MFIEVLIFRRCVWNCDLSATKYVFLFFKIFCTVILDTEYCLAKSLWLFLCTKWSLISFNLVFTFNSLYRGIFFSSQWAKSKANFRIAEKIASIPTFELSQLNRIHNLLRYAIFCRISLNKRYLWINSMYKSKHFQSVWLHTNRLSVYKSLTMFTFWLFIYRYSAETCIA